MFGTHLVGPSLMLNVAMRWPLLVPIALVAVSVNSVVEPPFEKAPQLAQSAGVMQAGFSDQKAPPRLSIAYVPSAADPGALDVSFTQTMGGSPAFEALPVLSTAPLTEPPPPHLPAARRATRLPDEPPMEQVEQVAVRDAAEPRAAVLQSVPEAVEEESWAPLPSATDSDSDESPGLRLLLPPP